MQKPTTRPLLRPLLRTFYKALSRTFQEACLAAWPPCREEKSVHYHHRKKSFGELFWSQKKTFQAGGRYKKPYKTQESHIHHWKSFLCGAHFLRERKVPYWSRALYAFFFQAMVCTLKKKSPHTITHKSITEPNFIIFEFIFGNSCSVITEPNCFWNYLVSVRSVSRGLPNPLPNCFGNSMFSNLGGGITEPNLFWNNLFVCNG